MTARYGAIWALLLIWGGQQVETPKNFELLHGKVIKISDGDTMTVLLEGDDHVSLKVRLEGIDAPEKSQAFGAKSADVLKGLIAGKLVEIQKTGEDKYGRSLAFVHVDGVNVNAKMVEDGWAWHYKKYNKDRQLAALEDLAKEHHRGLWSDTNPLPPWEFRDRQRSSPASPVEDDAKPDSPAPGLAHWLNTSSGVRHNKRCENFANTKRGRYCKPDEGKPCGKCGG